MNEQTTDAWEHRQTTGWLLVWFGMFGVTSAALAQWVFMLDLGFLSTFDMAVIGCITSLIGAQLVSVPRDQ
jgi:hypothetical protein